MFHAGMAATFAHCMIEEIIRSWCAERLDITEPESLDRFRRQLKFRDRHEIEAAQLSRGALAFGVEATDRFQCVAEEIEAHRLGGSGGIKIDDATANGIISA